MVMYEVREFDLAGVEGLSRRAIELHLDLYRGYVEQVNKLVTDTRAQASQGAPDHLNHDARARRLAFEFNGMVLHEVFFEALRGPERTYDKTGVFAEAVDESFGGFDKWRKDFLQMAAVRGVGWVLAMRDRQTNRLFNAWIDEHHLGVPTGTEPVLALDLWEHAYLLDYTPAKRGDYAQTMLDNVDWSVVESRCTVTQG